MNLSHAALPRESLAFCEVIAVFRIVHGTVKVKGLKVVFGLRDAGEQAFRMHCVNLQ